jgi:hypothetical protein
LGINSFSTETVNRYELGLRIRLASYQIEFSINGSDLLCYAGVHPTDRWAAMVGYWVAWGVAGWAKPVV